MRRLAAVLAVAAVLAAGCTSGAGTGPSTPVVSTQYSTVTSTLPAPPDPGPISSGPVTATTASSCPFLNQDEAADKVGMRLDRITVLKTDGALSGCRFYPLEHPNSQCSQTCLDAEKLPPGNQPAIEITSTTYPNATAAHNAFVTLATKGKQVQQAPIASGNTGLCFQTAFYPKDKGADWACTFSVKTRMVLVKTVVTNPAFNAIQIAKAIAPKF